MPLVTISLSEAWSTADQKLIADGVHEAIAGIGFKKFTDCRKINFFMTSTIRI